MPYISREGRKRLDPYIEYLAHHLNSYSDDQMAGLLNYICTNLALKVINGRPLKYHLLALITGVFSNIISELYRRLMAPYEDTKIADNGDLVEFEYARERMKK